MLDQLVGDRLGKIAGNRKADAHVTAAAAENGGVDTHHLAVQIDQRATGVTRIDRGIGLDEVLVVIDTDAGAAFGTDYTDGQRVTQTEGIADGHYPFTDLQTRRVSPS